MIFLSVKEASKITGIREGTIRQYIHRGKIASEKASNGRNKIPEFDVMRLKKEKAKIDSGKYLSAESLDKKGIPRRILFDGSVETEVLLNQTYVSWDEVKAWMQRTPSNISLASNERHEKTVQVLNKRGIHCAPATKICEICKNHYDHSNTQCEICFEGLCWHYPTNKANDLLSMKICYLKRVLLIGIGKNSKTLLKDLAQAFNNRFGLEG